MICGSLRLKAALGFSRVPRRIDPLFNHIPPEPFSQAILGGLDGSSPYFKSEDRSLWYSIQTQIPTTADATPDPSPTVNPDYGAIVSGARSLQDIRLKQDEDAQGNKGQETSIFQRAQEVSQKISILFKESNLNPSCPIIANGDADAFKAAVGKVLDAMKDLESNPQKAADQIMACLKSVVDDFNKNLRSPTAGSKSIEQDLENVKPLTDLLAVAVMHIGQTKAQSREGQVSSTKSTTLQTMKASQTGERASFTTKATSVVGQASKSQTTESKTSVAHASATAMVLIVFGADKAENGNKDGEYENLMDYSYVHETRKEGLEFALPADICHGGQDNNTPYDTRISTQTPNQMKKFTIDDLKKEGKMHFDKDDDALANCDFTPADGGRLHCGGIEYECEKDFKGKWKPKDCPADATDEYKIPAAFCLL
ncbi:hypothetical protein N7512_002167 [Penicillium capsulatum]|nr:hypothetical protein N7512_002167 [Penicillium capsulatum]